MSTSYQNSKQEGLLNLVLVVCIPLFLLLSCGALFTAKNSITVTTSAGFVECSFDILLESGRVLKSNDHCQFEIVKDGRFYQCLFSLKYLEEVYVIDITQECVIFL